MLLFDFAPEPRLCFSRPHTVFQATRSSEVERVLERVQEAVDAGFYAAGYVAYEAAPAFDPALSVHPPGPLPLVWFGIFNAPEAYAPPTEDALGRLGDWALDTSPEAYTCAVKTIREAIAAGVSYQANYTARLRGYVSGEPLALYERLHREHTSPYSSYLDTEDAHIVSLSPELFFRTDAGRVTAKPMKGTSARGRWPEEDERFKLQLLASPKERAENVMIVDLLRNDLGKLARPGSVTVPELFSLETYPTFHTLTSTVTAELSEKPTLLGLFRALFPCGSVTGAPKISTMKLLKRLEPTPRGVYCGAIGYAKPGGEMVFSVPIRTLVIEHKAIERGVIGNGTIDAKARRAEYGVGSGITWDSQAGLEYEELAVKAAAVTQARPEFKLLETLLWDGQGYALLGRHVARVGASARYFGFSLDADALRKELLEHVQPFSSQRRRVRALINQDGGIYVESTPYTPPPERPLVVLAQTPIDSRDPFLFHKTTRREVYAAHRKATPDAFDVLLWNERGELTEFTVGNAVLELDGVRVTPPQEAGLLVGTFCAELLASGEVVTRTLHKGELARASKVWLVNSVHGWVEVLEKPSSFPAALSPAKVVL